MPMWTPPYRTRRSYNIFSYAVNQNFALLNTGGEAAYLLKRKRRASAQFQLDERKSDYIDKSIYTVTLDPDTGMYRGALWLASVDSPNEYPDIGTVTCNVQSASGSSVWESAADKYSFLSGRPEYAFDIYQNQVNADGTDIEDAVYVVFNTPPYTAGNTARFKFGPINPYTVPEYMQPYKDSHTEYQYSLFAFDQWLNAESRVRRRKAPNQFLIAFPGTLTDITMTNGGFLRQANASHWTVPSGYNNMSPEIVEHDIVVRVSTGQRYQVVNLTKIFIEDVEVSQHFDLVELDPLSSVYQIKIVKT